METGKKGTLNELFLTFGYNEFNTDDIKRISTKHKFKNHFDVAKLDSSDQLSSLMLENDVFLLKVGAGKFKFQKGINSFYHSLEKITETKNLKYNPDLVMGDITSEGDLLKYVEINNILFDFLGDDVQSYGSGRRRTPTFNYFLGKNEIVLEDKKGTQIEMDELYKTKTTNTLYITEAKNKFLKNFNVSQLFFPYVYNSNIKNLKKFMNINCLFIQNKVFKDKYEVHIYEYRFTSELNIESIELVKCKKYNLYF